MRRHGAGVCPGRSAAEHTRRVCDLACTASRAAMRPKLRACAVKTITRGRRLHQQERAIGRRRSRPTGTAGPLAATGGRHTKPGSSTAQATAPQILSATRTTSAYARSLPGWSSQIAYRLTVQGQGGVPGRQPRRRPTAERAAVNADASGLLRGWWCARFSGAVGAHALLSVDSRRESSGSPPHTRCRALRSANVRLRQR